MSAPDEVIVVGGGLAGAAACLSLQQAGLIPVWVAPAAPPTDAPDDGTHGHADVGDSLTATAAPILRALGVADVLQAPQHRPSQAVFSCWGTDRLQERHAMQQLYGAGYVLDRAVFTADLAERAARTGTTLRDAVTELAPADGHWQLTLASGAQRTARAVIDATGRRATLARRLTPQHRLDTLVAAWAILPARDPDVEPTPATVIEAVAEGWWYAALRADGALSVAFFTDADLLPHGISRDLITWRAALARTQHISRWVEDAGFACETAPRLASAGTTWLAQPCGLHADAPWLAIGDAALALDPLSSHGMTSALWAGWQAGAWARDSLLGKDTAHQDYTGAVQRALTRYRQERQNIYQSEARFAGHPFWQRRQGPLA